MNNGGQSVLSQHYDARMYNALVSEYVGHSDFHNFGYWEPDTRFHKDACENLMEQLLAFIPEKNRNARVLDVACGKGATTRHLFRHFAPANITGINISEKQLDTARANAPDATFRIMDAAQLEFSDESFDHLVCVEAAFHFNTRGRFLEEALRVLKPGGWLVLSDVLMTHDAENSRPGRIAQNYLEDPSAYETLVRGAGFDPVTVRDVTEQCWRRFFWSAIRFHHGKLLAKQIGIDDLKAVLEPTYRRVGDITYYLLVGARKP